MSIARTRLATVLLAVLGLPIALHAQALALTNADVTRLVMAGVSDQTVMAVIHEASATRFDLGPQALDDLAAYGLSAAVINAMRQPSTPTPSPINWIVAPAQPATGAQTLAGAAAAAATMTHTWTRSTSTGPSRKPALPARAASTPVGTRAGNAPATPRK